MAEPMSDERLEEIRSKSEDMKNEPAWQNVSYDDNPLFLPEWVTDIVDELFAEVDRLRQQETWLRGMMSRTCDGYPGLVLAKSHGITSVVLRDRKGREADAERLDKFLAKQANK